MFTAMISRLHLLVVFLVLALAVGLGWAGFEWSRDRFADRSNAPGAPASEQAAAGGRPTGSTARAPAAPDQVAPRRSERRSSRQRACGPAAAAAAATEQAARVDSPGVAPTSPKLAARDQAPPSKESGDRVPRADRRRTTVRPGGQTGRSESLTRRAAKPPCRSGQAASPAVPSALPPAEAGVTEPPAEDRRRRGVRRDRPRRRSASPRAAAPRRPGWRSPAQPPPRPWARSCGAAQAESIPRRPARRSPWPSQANRASCWTGRAGSSAGTGRT